MLSIFTRRGEIGSVTPIPVNAVLSKGIEQFLAERDAGEVRWLKAVGFGAKDGELVMVPNSEGGIGSVVLGLGAGRDPHALALCSERLPGGLYTLGQIPSGCGGPRAAYAWAIGSYAFVGGGSRVNQDIPPYVKAVGNPMELYGLNTIGLQRAGFSPDTVAALKRAYRLFFNSDLNLSQALERARTELPGFPEIDRFLAFVESSERGVPA